MKQTTHFHHSISDVTLSEMFMLNILAKKLHLQSNGLQEAQSHQSSPINWPIQNFDFKRHFVKRDIHISWFSAFCVLRESDILHDGRGLERQTTIVLFKMRKGFPGAWDGKESACNRPGFIPWVRKMLWRREWHPTPVSLPGEFHGQKILVGYNP